MFALQTGDGIFAVFSMATLNAYILGYIFTFVYTFLIISTVQSIFMVVVEDAYIQARYSTRFSWLLELEHDASNKTDISD